MNSSVVPLISFLLIVSPSIHPTVDICLPDESVGASRSSLLGPQDIGEKAYVVLKLQSLQDKHSVSSYLHICSVPDKAST